MGHIDCYRVFFSVGWLVELTPYVVAGFVIVYSFFAIGDSPVLRQLQLRVLNHLVLGRYLGSLVERVFGWCYFAGGCRLGD